MADWREEKRKLVESYRERNKTAVKGGVVFAGSSLMEQFPVEEWVREQGDIALPVYNRGIGGYTTKDLLPILDVCVWELAPKKVFINIGTNDVRDANEPIPMIRARYDDLLRQIEAHLPGAVIYLMAYYPVNPDAADENMKRVLAVRSNARIDEANRAVELLAKAHGQRYIDVNAPLKDGQGRLRAEYTVEGMHINRAGYQAIFEDLMRYVKE